MSDTTYISATQLRERFGGVSKMWIRRRLQGDPTFPRPKLIGPRRFWSLSEIEAWEANLPEAGARSPQGQDHA